MLPQNNASTTKHGFAPKAIAPALGIINLLGVANGETTYTCKALVDNTNPEPLGTAAPGTSLIAARRDHVHTMPKLDEVAAPTDVTTLNVSTSAHGLCPKAPGDTTQYLRGDGTWATPSTSGSATIIAGDTYVDVTHGLATTPTRVQVTPTSNLGTGHFWVDTKGATTFRININASDSIDHTFDWEAEV